MPALKYDGNIDIATGRSRHESNWKNKQILWSELVKKVSKTHRTAETYDEYINSSKDRQDEIKDVGGFVGAYLANGKRKKGSAVHRQLITLDIDFCRSDVWEDFTLMYDNAAAIYSTHKHTKTAPRYRLLIPLSREVFADEYIAIARKIAGNLGIENFDNTTFQPERLMYWPSTAADADYYTDVQDGVWLDADEVLSSYRNWRDASEWPVSERYSKLISREIKKQGDPLEKPGIIGAFCRTYTIDEVIGKYLTDVYEVCDVPNRYSYKEGSTSAGLIVYEDKYAFSHHGTDPISGKLCNAFDLVRLHLFGLKDEEVTNGTPGNKLPSFTAMQDFCVKDPAVKKIIAAERIESATNDFIDIDTGGNGKADKEWLSQMEVDRKGKFYSTINNIVLVLNNDEHLKGTFAFNMFEQREIALRNLPWRKLKTGKYLTDKDDAAIRHYFENVYGITGIQKIRDGLDIVLMANSFHPVRDYLSILQWDGEERIETLLIDYLGAEDNDYVRTVTRKTLIAAVARVFEPGIKFDNALTLIGRQGLKKSTLVAKLGGEWFSDSFTTVQGKEAFEQIQGVWLMEMAELAGLKKAETEVIKHFISKCEDRYRVAYGRRLENFPRQCVFIATSNIKNPLQDTTGNRRWWPVECGGTEAEKDPFDINSKERNQIWAEAFRYYKLGESIYLDKEIEDLAVKNQFEATEHDDRTEIVRKYLDTLLPENWEGMNIYERREFIQGGDLIAKGIIQRQRVCVMEIWCEVIGGSLKDFNKRVARELHDLMRGLKGWESYKSKTDFKNYGTQRAYFRLTAIVEKLP